MSHDTVWVTFSFCTSWPRYTPRAELYSLRPFIWYVTQCAAGNFLILHLMTPEHPRAKFYLSRRFIWYITWYLFGNLFILQLMTPVYPKAKLYSLRPFIWHVTRYRLGNFDFALNDPGLSLGWTLLIETFQFICCVMTFRTLFILHLMTPVYPWAELYSSRPLIWYVTRYPSSHIFYLHLMTPERPRADL